MTIQVTLSFANTEEMLAYFSSERPVKAPAVTAKPETAAKKEAAAPKAEKPKAEPKAETPTPTPTPADTATDSPTASSAPSVDYPTLQKAVFALANAKGRDAVVNLLKDKFSVNSAKELAAEQYADALAAVTAATEA